MRYATAPVSGPDQRGQQVFAVLDLLLTVGYIDGLFHTNEQAFIRSYMDRLVERFAESEAARTAWRERIESAYARLAEEVSALAAEVVAAGEDTFMKTRLQARAVALFRSFTPSDQKVALELLRAIARSDGEVSREEQAMLDQLEYLFRSSPALPMQAAVPRQPSHQLLRVEREQTLELGIKSHPLLEPIERRYSSDPALLQQQLAADYELIFQAINRWERMRSWGAGRLVGTTSVDQIPRGTRLLDGHVHVLRPAEPVELIVLGDLHGSYACFKAALMQSQFIERALRRKQDPANNPDVKLVLLGDYIDRGTFGFEGVLRAALHLFVSFPDQVILLRGNHELLARVDGRVISAVTPAEALAQLATRAPTELLEAYRHLFEHMPTSLLCDRTLFAHGGIPREDTLDGRFRDLSALDDQVVRFEMMWSDPMQTDIVPVELQRANARFTFGRDQFRAFMQKIDCDTMIRGHEQVDAGFKTVFDIGDHKLHTLFSVGGRDNTDLPEDSRYRRARPMALTIRVRDGEQTATPWAIAYNDYTNSTYNGLYRLL